jgi:hypothetical protein
MTIPHLPAVRRLLRPALVILLSIRAAAEEPAVYHIQSAWIGERHLILQEEALASGKIVGGNGRWQLEKDGPAHRIRSAGGSYLRLADGSDDVILVAAPPDDERGRWLIEPVDGGVSIASQATRKYLNIENLKLPPRCSSDKKPSRSHWTSGLWNLKQVDGGPGLRFHKPGQAVVVSPSYGSAIQGDTTFQILAPGKSAAEIVSWLPGGRFGKRTTLDKVVLDADGGGSFVFPAKRFPRGPVTISILVDSPKSGNNLHFMVYNEDGVPWREGSPEASPPAAEGMKLVFLDDFDRPQLPITRDGKGGRYMSHKPGGGDFSGIRFGDHEDPATTPFSQSGTWLRIRADEGKNTTGLLASINSQGQGVTASAPCYFECRFIAQSAPGTWPAFWVMTNYMTKEHDKPAVRRQSDELDIIEAYGGEGPGTPNAPGYMIHSHFWNQAPGGKKDYTQDRFAGPIPMTSLKGGGGASWFETFHTYGLLVGREDTVYYCDDIEVARHKTARLSGSEPMFFFVNLAVGGVSGWKMDLSRLGGKADMYVDYIRVYQGK